MRSYANQSVGTVPRARQLRRDAPEPERHLLRTLRAGFAPLKWRHQVPIGDYYADILCFSEKLVIEVDGDTHGTTATYDAARTRFIEGEGYRVLRFTNADVMQNLEGILTQISFSLREKEAARRVSGGKDEGGRTQNKGSAAEAAPPSPFRRYGAPSLSRRERESAAYSSSSNVTATSPFAESRTTSPSTSATSPSEMK